MINKIKCFFKGHKFVVSKFQIISDPNLNYECAVCGKLK